MLAISIIIPFFNEETYLEQSVTSLLTQTYTAKELILVDDGSTDKSAEIAASLVKKHKSIRLIKTDSSSVHEPGEKVIRAFNRGFLVLSESWDVVCKFDADVIFPSNYLENLAKAFEMDANLGMFSGVLTIEKRGVWELENISTQHVRGPVKAYRKSCFTAIGGLRPALGWDTLDELLALYRGFAVQTDSTLHVKHLRPTGFQHNRSAAKAKGEVFYSLGYGVILGMLASIKWVQKQRGSLAGVLLGFFSAWLKRKPKLVTKKQGKYIRNYRWLRIRRRFVS